MGGRFAYSSTGEIIDVGGKEDRGSLQDETSREVQSEKVLDFNNRERQSGSGWKSVRRRQETQLIDSISFLTRCIGAGKCNPESNSSSSRRTLRLRCTSRMVPELSESLREIGRH
jgi:hypothetical protein